MVKVHDGQLANRRIYAAIGRQSRWGEDILGVWAGIGEGVQVWVAVSDRPDAWRDRPRQEGVPCARLKCMLTQTAIPQGVRKAQSALMLLVIPRTVSEVVKEYSRCAKDERMRIVSHAKTPWVPAQFPLVRVD